MKSVKIRDASNAGYVLRIITESCSLKFDLAECDIVLHKCNKVDMNFTCTFICTIGDEEEVVNIEFDEVFTFDDDRTVNIDMKSLLSCGNGIEGLLGEILAKTGVITIEKLGDGDISEVVDHYGHITLKSPFIYPKTLNARLTKKMMEDLFIFDNDEELD